MGCDEVQSNSSKPSMVQNHRARHDKKAVQKISVVKSIPNLSTKNDATLPGGFSDKKKLPVGTTKLFDRKRPILTSLKTYDEQTPTSNLEKLNVLASVKVHLKIVGCMPIDETRLPSWCAKLPLNRIHIGFIFLILLMNILTTFWFYIREVETFIDFSESLFWASRSILSTVLYTMLVWHRYDLLQFIDTLEEIVENRRQNEALYMIYQKKNKKSKVIPRNMCIYIFISVPILYVSPVMYNSFHDFYTSNHSPDAFQLFYNIALPFDWKSPATYLIASFFQLLFFLSVLEIFITFLAIYFGICHFCVALVEDIEKNFDSFREIALNCRNRFPFEKRSELLLKLFEIIKFHTKAMQFVLGFSRFYKKFLSMFFVISTTYLCIFCLRIQTDIDVKDALSIFRSIIRLSGWIVGFYFICHFGGEVTSRFQDIVYSIYDCPWYSMPLKIRKYFPLMIAATQQPIYLNGCFNIRCIQETFQKMVYAAFSYFMVLREII